jgi:hypothetical protein
MDGTGLPKIAVCKAIQGLVSMNLIVKTANFPEGITHMGNVTHMGNELIPTYCFQKDYELWKPLPKRVTLPNRVMTVTHMGNDHYPYDRPQKQLLQKTLKAYAPPLRKRRRGYVWQACWLISSS